MHNIPESVLSLILNKASSDEINNLYTQLTGLELTRHTLYRLRKRNNVQLKVGGFRRVKTAVLNGEVEERNYLFRKVNQLWRPTA